MYDHEVESLFDGLRWLALEALDGFVLMFEYGMGDNGLREIWLNHSTVGWNVEVPFGFGFCIINMRLFLYVFL